VLKKDSAITHEYNSGVPVAKPTNLRVPTQSERILAYVRFEQLRAAQSKEVETFEEADDFELDDGEQWFSPYEETFESPAEPPPDTPPVPDVTPPVPPVATET